MKLIGLLSSLRNKVIAVIILFGVIFWAEFLVLSSTFKNLNEKQLQAELMQRSVINSRDLALKLQLFVQGDKELLKEITALANRQDEQLQLLAKGGRIESSTEVVKPLSFLSKISLDQIEVAWNNYKRSTITISTNEMWKDSVATQPEPGPADSLSETITPESVRVLNPKVIEVRTLIDGQWMTLTTKYNELLKDLELEEA